MIICISHRNITFTLGTSRVRVLYAYIPRYLNNFNVTIFHFSLKTHITQKNVVLTRISNYEFLNVRSFCLVLACYYVTLVIDVSQIWLAACLYYLRTFKKNLSFIL